MYKIVIVMLFSLYLSADELDMFDVVDVESNLTEDIASSSLVASIQLSQLFQNESKNKTVLYANISENIKHFFYDVRLVADKNTYEVYLKDLYYKTNIGEKYFFELGRMSIKEGVARGYNPTDYFKGGSALTLSVDPKERKDNRLGSVLFQGTYISDNYTLKALYAPKISVDSKSYWADEKHFGLKLNESNAQNRTTLYVGYTGLDDWSFSVLLHNNDDGVHVGTNISYIDERAILYIEASVNKREKQITQSLKEIHAPSNLIGYFDSDEENRMEVSLGLNYTFKNSVVGTFEYIYSSSGLNSNGWKKYFDTMKTPMYAAKLGEARGKVANNAQRLSKHTIFTMFRRNDALPNLDWVSMAWIHPTDKSALLQVGVSYDYEDIVISADIRMYMGKDKSEYGSMKNDYEALLSMAYFF